MVNRAPAVKGYEYVGFIVAQIQKHAETFTQIAYFQARFYNYSIF
jgi:hypothetical protein